MTSYCEIELDSGFPAAKKIISVTYLVSCPHHHCHYSSHCFCFLSNNYSYLHLQWSFETTSPERIKHFYVPSVLVKRHFQGHCKNPHICFLLKCRKPAMETSRDNQYFFLSEHLYMDEKFTSVLKFKRLNCSINWFYLVLSAKSK